MTPRQPQPPPDAATPEVPTTPAAATAAASAHSGVTWRGWLAGIIGVPVTCLLVSWAEMVLMTLQIGYLQMPPAVIGLLLLLLIISALLRRVSRRFALTPQDLLIAYSMMTLASMISSRGMMQKLIPLLVTANYLGSDANDWRNLYYPHIKQWLVPFDVKGADKQEISVRFFESLRAGETIPWEHWVGPVAVWCILVLLVFGGFLCMAAILRRQWVDNEKLSFPLVQLPLEMVGYGDVREGYLFHNRLMWLGFALPMVVFLFKGLHAWYPSVPDIPLSMLVSDLLQNPPYNGIYYTLLNFSFAITGFMFLLPSDLVFSLWFFFVLTRVQDVVARALNMDLIGMPMYPTYLYRGYQAMGAYFVLTAYLLWVARPHLRKVWRTVIGEESGDDASELLPYRAAFFGFWACFLGAVLFLTLIGMSPLVAVMQLGGLFFIIAFIMARSTAEAGMLMTEASFRPIDFFRLFAPVHTLGAANMATLALTDSLLLRDQRSLVLSGFLDGLRMADGANIRRRRFLGVFITAILLAIVVAAAIQIYLPYERGGITMYGYVYNANNKWGFEDYQQHLKRSALPMGWQGPTFLMVGIAATALLVYGRATMAWFPFHPLGYALCSSWTMIVFWFSALCAWVIKALILRYGGMKLYRQARPFFLGMILGEFTAALLWTLANAVLDTPVPPFPWA